MVKPKTGENRDWNREEGVFEERELTRGGLYMLRGVTRYAWYAHGDQVGTGCRHEEVNNRGKEVSQDITITPVGERL